MPESRERRDSKAFEGRSRRMTMPCQVRPTKTFIIGSPVRRKNNIACSLLCGNFVAIHDRIRQGVNQAAWTLLNHEKTGDT